MPPKWTVGVVHRNRAMRNGTTPCLECVDGLDLTLYPHWPRPHPRVSTQGFRHLYITTGSGLTTRGCVESTPPPPPSPRPSLYHPHTEVRYGKGGGLTLVTITDGGVPSTVFETYKKNRNVPPNIQCLWCKYPTSPYLISYTSLTAPNTSWNFKRVTLYHREQLGL